MANLGLNDIQLTDSGQTLTGTSEADVIDISIGSGSNELLNSVVTVNAGGGDDIVIGSWIHNFINGDVGDDKIYAGKTVGIETIDGGEGNDTVVLNFNPFYNLTSYSNENGIIAMRTNNNTMTQVSNVESFVFSIFPQNDVKSNFIEEFSFTLSVQELDAFVAKIDLERNADVATDQLTVIADYVITDGGFVLTTDNDPNGYLIGSEVNFVRVSVSNEGVNFSSLDLGTDNQLATIVVEDDAIGLLSGMTLTGIDSIETSNLVPQAEIASARQGITTLSPQLSINGATVTPENYEGPVDSLDYQYLGNNNNESAFGSIHDDFINLLGGDDAADGGLGNDVLDGGAGSNFLTGGSGSDTFFLDGRSGDITWSTISDFDGDEVNIWGWNEGVSRLLLTEEDAGAEGFKGATFHYDLDNDGSIDTSITFTGLTYATMPNSTANVVEGNGYLLFSQAVNNTELLM